MSVSEAQKTVSLTSFETIARDNTILEPPECVPERVVTPVLDRTIQSVAKRIVPETSDVQEKNPIPTKKIRTGPYEAPIHPAKPPESSSEKKVVPSTEESDTAEFQLEEYLERITGNPALLTDMKDPADQGYALGFLGFTLPYLASKTDVDVEKKDLFDMKDEILQKIPEGYREKISKMFDVYRSLRRVAPAAEA